MTKYSILLTLEDGSKVEIPCKNVKDYKRKSTICEETLPNKDWKETRIKGEKNNE